jgi:hypothetical protein
VLDTLAPAERLAVRAAVEEQAEHDGNGYRLAGVSITVLARRPG